jgi:2,5-diketo-D-gluconate reductase B
MAIDFPPVGLGTMGLTGEDGIETIVDALEMGYRHLDTAQIYGTETEVGAAIDRADVPREDVTVASKIGTDNFRPADVKQSTRASRDRLGVETIDLMYIHQPKQTYQPRETLGALADLRDDGVIDHIGVSKFNRALLDDAREILGELPAANQVELHPTYQQRELVEYARGTEMTLVAFSPLRQGDPGDVSELAPIAERHDATPAQVALAWLTAKEPVVAIPKASSSAHLRENLAATDLSLSPAEHAAIDGIQRVVPR